MTVLVVRLVGAWVVLCFITFRYVRYINLPVLNIIQYVSKQYLKCWKYILQYCV